MERYFRSIKYFSSFKCQSANNLRWGSVKKFGTLENVIKNLPGRKIFEFGGIEPNPQYETLMKAVDIAKKKI